MEKFVLASHNPNKLREMGEILGKLGIEVVSPASLNIDVDVEETGTTFEENSMLKAKAIMELSGLPAIADDSGLCVDCLNGAPRCLLRPLRRRGSGRSGPLPPPAGEYAGPDAPDGQICVRHHLLLPQWGSHHRPGRVSRYHRFCTHGGERLRL